MFIMILLPKDFRTGLLFLRITTTDDLTWWFRYKYLELDIEIGNHPSIYVQRNMANIEKYPEPAESFPGGRTNNAVNVVIRRGDAVI